MAAHQAPLSLGFSRQEHWSGLPFPSPMHESEKWKWSHSVLSDSSTPWTAAYQAPPSMGFSRQEYCSGVPLASPKWILGNSKHSDILFCLRSYSNWSLSWASWNIERSVRISITSPSKPKVTRLGTDLFYTWYVRWGTWSKMKLRDVTWASQTSGSMRQPIGHN